MDRGDVMVGGVRIACFVAGRPEHPGLVMLHALGADASTWQAIWPDLEARFRVVAIDMRGHGNSDWPGEYSFELMRDDVLGVIEELGLVRPTLLGHSMGGSVAYLIAEESPNCIERLVIEDTPPPYPQPGRPLPERPPEPLPFDWPVVAAIRAQVDDPDPSYWSQLGEIAAPTLMIAGASSHIDQTKIAEAADRIRNATLVTIPAGHYVHEERPGEFVAALLTWLGTAAQ